MPDDATQGRPGFLECDLGACHRLFEQLETTLGLDWTVGNPVSDVATAAGVYNQVDIFTGRFVNRLAKGESQVVFTSSTLDGRELIQVWGSRDEVSSVIQHEDAVGYWQWVG